MDLERQLNEVLDRWLDKHHIDAGWYERGDVIAQYKSNGTEFVCIGGERNEP